MRKAYFQSQSGTTTTVPPPANMHLTSSQGAIGSLLSLGAMWVLSNFRLFSLETFKPNLNSTLLFLEPGYPKGFEKVWEQYYLL